MSQVAGVTAQMLAWITTAIGIWFIAETFVILSDVKPDFKPDCINTARLDLVHSPDSLPHGATLFVNVLLMRPMLFSP